MAQVVVNEASLSDIAQALRTKLGTNETFKPSQMGDGVRRLPSASSAPVLITKQISANGTYAASGDDADGYSSVEVSVANSYSQSDEGKVVDNGALVAQTSLSITSNDTYDTTKNNEIVVNVANSYSSSDEGKVVDSGALVAQTSQSITQNGTYDTTTNNEIVVNVSGGGGGSAPIYSGTSAPSSSLGNNEDLYIQYEAESAQFDHTYKITNIFRKVSGSWVAYTEPESSAKGVHIWTKSTGGYDAAMYVQPGYWDGESAQFVTTGNAEAVVYSSVDRGQTPYNCNNVAHLLYGGSSGGGWQVYADVAVTDGTNTYAINDLVKNWAYNVSVDFYVWRNV